MRRGRSQHNARRAGFDLAARHRSEGFTPLLHCHDCGGRPKWLYADWGGYEHYCKRCLSKAGHCTAVLIDIDELEKIVGPTVTQRVLAKGEPARGLW